MGMIKRVYGRNGQHSTCYLTRIKLTPKTRWGQLYFHIFHRGDLDRDFHDHPYDFWTFPLRTYYEDVLDHATGRVTQNVVKAFHWHFRLAEYTHIQFGSAHVRRIAYVDFETGFPTNSHRETVFGGWTATLLWHKPVRREWGFWVQNFENPYERCWVPWREYLFS